MREQVLIHPGESLPQLGNGRRLAWMERDGDEVRVFRRRDQRRATARVSRTVFEQIKVGDA